MNFKSNKGITRLAIIIIIVAAILIIGLAIVLIAMAGNQETGFKVVNFEESIDTGNEQIVNSDDTADDETDDTNNFKFSFVSDKKSNIKVIAKSNSYNIVNFGGDGQIVYNSKTYTIKEALKEKIITINTILKKLENDAKNDVCAMEYYWDGGSQEYLYDTFTVFVTNLYSEKVQDIVFATPKFHLNAYFMIKEEPYTGSDYDEGLAVSAVVNQIVNDKMWLINMGDSEYVLKIEDGIKIDTNIKEGDKINIVFSGEYTVGYEYRKYNNDIFSDEEQVATFYIYNDSPEQTAEGEEFTITEILGNRCWIVEPKSEDEDSLMLIIESNNEIKGDEPRIGSKVIEDGGFGKSSINTILKDVIKIEKAH